MAAAGLSGPRFPSERIRQPSQRHRTGIVLTALAARVAPGDAGNRLQHSAPGVISLAHGACLDQFTRGAANVVTWLAGRTLHRHAKHVLEVFKDLGSVRTPRVVRATPEDPGGGVAARRVDERRKPLG